MKRWARQHRLQAHTTIYSLNTMKLPSLSFILASTGLAVLQASASPIRVVMISATHPPTNIEVNHFRFGLAAANANVPLPDIPSSDFVVPQGAKSFPHSQGKKMGCGRWRQLSSWMREQLGLPRSEPHYRLITAGSHMPHHDGQLRPLSSTVHILPHRPLEEGNKPHNHYNFGHGRPHSFTGRLQKALMTLGPWEGRAVAFVLGCGIGTLLRMFYVLALLSFRSRSSNSDHDEVDIVFEEVEAVPAPPAYSDEKVMLVEEKASA